MATSVVHEGWLTKRAPHTQNWKLRYMILTDDGILRYFKSLSDSKSAKPCGEVDVKMDCCGVSRGDDVEWPNFVQLANRIALQTLSRTFYMYSDTSDAAAEWIKVLRVVAKLEQSSRTDWNASGAQAHAGEASSSSASHEHSSPGRSLLLDDATYDVVNIDDTARQFLLSNLSLNKRPPPKPSSSTKPKELLKLVEGNEDDPQYVAPSQLLPPKPTSSKPPLDHPPTERPPAERPPTERPPMERPPTERPPAVRPPADRPPADRPPTERPPMERPPPRPPRAPEGKPVPAVQSHSPSQPHTTTQQPHTTQQPQPHSHPLNEAFTLGFDHGRRGTYDNDNDLSSDEDEPPAAKPPQYAEVHHVPASKTASQTSEYAEVTHGNVSTPATSQYAEVSHGNASAAGLPQYAAVRRQVSKQEEAAPTPSGDGSSPKKEATIYTTLNWQGKPHPAPLDHTKVERSKYSDIDYQATFGQAKNDKDDARVDDDDNQDDDNAGDV
eukprot:m.76427 g.76427  ORF g.76427 m.76427 type:complete len:496 (+) comp14637_c0_seq1:36-1523(+)